MLLSNIEELAPGEGAFRRTAVKIWIEQPMWWDAYDYLVDPIGSMMQDWYKAVDPRAQTWS